MSSDFPSRIFLLALLLSPITLVGNFQNVFAANLTPVADLTGQWSGFAQFTILGGYCEFSGSVNAYLEQDGNSLVGEFSWVATSSKSIDPEIYECSWQGQSYSDDIQGTISGSQLALQSSVATFTGWYASSGIKLDIVFDDAMIGITQLSPTGFSPPAFTPEDEPTQPTQEEKDSDGDGIPDNVDECIGLLEDYYGENEEDGCPEKDTDGDEWFDYEDSCLYDPEDYIGIEDGCPEEEEDTDGDTFYDDEDECIYEAEDFFEFGKLDGCPEYDTDGDNIYDSIDQCIDEPEDTTGDIDGCPNQDEFVEDEFVEEESLTETPPKFTEPPSPLVLPVTEEKKPLLKALWDGRCDTLSHQWQLLTGQSGQVPLVCTDGKITFQSGDQIEFSIADDWDVKLKDLYMEKAQEILVSTLVVEMPAVAALLEMFEPFEKTHGKIGNIKALHLTLKTGETELLGGLIQIKAKCILPECKFIKLEEEGGGFKFYSLPTFFGKDTNEVVTELAHGSVYILIEYTPIEKVTTPTAKDGGCLIATATFGSELAPQVQFLREIRDNTVLSTASGTSFMTAFNSFYYSFSPAVADLERQNPMFKELVKVTITPLLSSLSLLQYVDIDSEEEMLGYGIGIILLNIGMYFVAPTLIIFKLKNRKKLH